MSLWYSGENHTADNVLIANSPEGLQIALIERKSDPFQGCYAFPGGFVDTNSEPGSAFALDVETPRQAALRELEEEVSVQLDDTLLLSMEEIGFYNDRNRDPRSSDDAWVASTAFLIHLSKTVPLTAADDAASAEWKPLRAVLRGDITLAFDHATILSDAIRKFEVLNEMSEEKLQSNYVQGKIQNYLKAKAYAKAALAERKVYEKDPKNYDPKKAPELVRDGAAISLENVKSGVSPTLFRSVENIPTDAAYKICQLLDVDGREPMIPYVEALIRKHNLDKADEPEAPSP